MEEKLTKLYNALALVETKGESTKIMANCLVYLDQLVKEAHASKVAPVPAEEHGGE